MKKLNSLDFLDSEIVHSPFFPEEVRENDGITTTIQRDGSWKEYRLWRYSPFGLEIISDLNEFKSSDVVSMKVQFLREEIFLESIKVATISEQNGKEFVSFRTFRKEPSLENGKERRKATRWACPQDLLPTGSAPNPIRFNDFIIFRIEDISSGGCRVITSMRNKFLYQGQFLESALSLPLVGNVGAVLKIAYIDTVERSGKAYIVFGANFVNPDKILLSCLSEYLLHFGQDISSETLRRDGFLVRPNLISFDFSYVKTREEYEQVLSLRKNAYVAAKKISSQVLPKDMSDVFDSRARILIVKKNGAVVGSVRVMFHDSFQESELYKDGVREISGISYDEAVEASRLCIDLNYRGIDIAYSLLSHFSLTALKANKRYIFGGAHGFLVDFYRNAGWRVLETAYSCSSLQNIPHQIVYVDLHEVVLGRNISPRAWNRLYKEMFYYLTERGIVKPTPADRLRIKLYELVGL